jgi:hypothetical protein
LPTPSIIAWTQPRSLPALNRLTPRRAVSHISVHEIWPRNRPPKALCRLSALVPMSNTLRRNSTLLTEGRIDPSTCQVAHGSRYSNGPNLSRDGPVNGSAPSPPMRSPIATAGIGPYFAAYDPGRRYVSQGFTDIKGTEVSLATEVRPRKWATGPKTGSSNPEAYDSPFKLANE